MNSDNSFQKTINQIVVFKIEKKTVPLHVSKIKNMYA